MTPSVFSETTEILRVFQILTVIAPTVFYLAASIASSFSSKKAQKDRHGNLRNAQISLTCVAVTLSAAEATLDLSRTDPARASDPDAVYALFLSLVNTVLLLGLVDSPLAASYCHYGAWTILLVCQGTVHALCVSTLDGDRLMFARAILQGLQLTVIFILLTGSLCLRYLTQKSHDGTDDETRLLLANDNPPGETGVDTEAKEADEEDDIDRLRIRNRPFWEYVTSFKIFVPYTYPKALKLRLYFFGMCCLSALTRVLTIALPLSLGALVNGLGASVPWNAIATYVLIRFSLSAAGVPLLEIWLAYRVNVDLTVALQRYCYDHIMNLSADFHDSKKTSVIWQITYQGQEVVDLLHDLLFSFLPQMVDMVSAMVVLTYIFGLYMAFIVAITAVLFYWLAFKSLVTKRSLRRLWLDAYHDQYYQMTESTSNWSTVSYFGRIPYEIGVFQAKGDVTRNRMLSWWAWEFWTRGVRHVVPCVAFAAACFLAALQIARHQHKIGDFVVLVTYWSQLTGPLASIAGELSKLTDKLVNAEKLLAILERTPQVQDLPTAQPFNYIEGAVEFENVSFSYDGQRQVTKGITFRAAPGKTVALVGQTGGGKSTILRLLFRFYDVNQGRILIDGQDIRHIKMEGFRKHIAMVPQNPVVFNMSVLENIRYPDIDCTDEEAIAACKVAALHDKIMSFTKGYQEKVGERGTKLSGGELQRLAIARAILKKADILLLDEATSSVDSITEKQIQESLHQLCRGKTAFVIAHRLSTILHADHILVIKDGEIVEAGTHDALIERGGAYNELWRSQLRLQAEGVARSRSSSRPGDKSDAQVLVNDLSTSGEESQNLVKSLSRRRLDKAALKPAGDVGSDSSSMCRSGHRNHATSHDTQDKKLSTKITEALSRRMSRSRSPKKAPPSGSVLNPDAQTFKLSRSKSPEKERKGESALNPEVATFRPRRFQDGNHSSSLSTDESFVPGDALDGSLATALSKPVVTGTVVGKENGSTAPSAKAAFHLRRKWTGKGRESLTSSEDRAIDDSESTGQDAGDGPGDALSVLLNGAEVNHGVTAVSGNVRRRQAASEPCRETGTEEDDSEDSSEFPGMVQASKYSRLPQSSRGRAVSAMVRETTALSDEQQLEDENGTRAPVNTATTTPGATTPGATTPGATTPGATTPGATTPGLSSKSPGSSPA